MLETLGTLALFIVAPVLLTTGRHMTESKLAKLITVIVMLTLGIMIGIAWS